MASRACTLSDAVVDSRPVMAMGTLEFGAAVDGIGCARLQTQTYVTALLFNVLGAAIVIPAYQSYRGRIPYAVGFLMGPIFFVVTFVLGAQPRPALRAVCDTAEAPTACYAAVWSHRETCLPELDDTCFERLERSCKFGKIPGCDMLVSNGSWSETQVCETLSDTCEKTLRCGTRGFSQHCDPDSGQLRSVLRRTGL